MFGLSQKEKNSALYEALDHGRSETAKRLLDKGADPNFTTYSYGPVLFRAISQNAESTALACVTAMIAAGASVTATDDSYGRTALHNAIYRTSGHLEVIKALIDAGADVNVIDRYGCTPLQTAIAQKGWRAANMLLDYCARDDKSAGSVLITAITNGAPVSLLSRLVEKLDIDINSATQSEGATALHAAVAAGNLPAMEWVQARRGVNVDAKNQKEETALLLAVASGRADIARALLEAGAQPDLKDADGNAPIVVAARGNKQDIIEMLVNAKAELDASDKYGMTALCAASSAGSIRMVMTLLAAAGNTGVKLVLEPALFAAAERGHGRVLELLIAAGANVNHFDADGRTPLMRAVNADQIETLSILIKAGAKPDIADRHGMFAYDHAVSTGKTKAKDYLARYRHEAVKTAEPASVALPSEDFHYLRLNDHSLEVREGDGLTMTFNFWTQQIIFRDTERPAPVTVQNFADLQRQEAIDEAYCKLKELGGNPPDPRAGSMQKKMPGLK